MVPRRLADGSIAYYWVAPTWAVKTGYFNRSEPLGTDYGEAKRRCDEFLNPTFDEWRTRGGTPAPLGQAAIGTFDWMVGVNKSSPKYSGKGEKTRRDYLISQHVLKDGRTFGSLALKSITPGVADRLYERLRVKANGTERTRTAILAMRVAQRAWNVARRDKPDHVAFENPFAKMGLSYTAKPTRPVSYGELMRFVAAG
jgi:hypothetical protein